MKKIKVAINGCGRIGRAFLKLAVKRPELQVVAVNDLGDIKDIAYLLNYDSVYGQSGLGARAEGSDLIVDGNKIAYVSEKDPAVLAWAKFCVDVVVEATGRFTSFESARVHITAGAKKVVVTAPVKDSPKDKTEATVLMGVNEEMMGGATVTSNASCTTNSASPLIAILDEAIGIEKAVLNTVHAYTASQGIVDGPNKKDFREGRAGAVNIVPSSTGAAIAVTKAFPKLEGLFDGISIRVPVVIGSIVDVTFIAKRETSAEEVNKILSGAAAAPRWKEIFGVTTEPLVSSDIIGQPLASLADLSFTRVVGGNLVKVLAWYDNEMGYTYTLVEHVIRLASSL